MFFFGNWDLAFAAYNMGYGGLLSSIRKFNTNSFWELRRLEAGLPYETAQYVPKIMALAIAARNCKVFGCGAVKLAPPAPFGSRSVDKLAVAPGVTLDDIAKAAGVKPGIIKALNPQFIGSRLPPLQQAGGRRKSWTIYLPPGSAQKAASAIPSHGVAHRLATYQVRWGESLTHVARRLRTSNNRLILLNDLHPFESPRPGTTLFIPAGRTPKGDGEVFANMHRLRKQVVVVPHHGFHYPNRRRVIYQAVFGDKIDDVARVCNVSIDELTRWNHLDRRATLQDGMRLVHGGCPQALRLGVPV